MKRSRFVICTLIIMANAAIGSTQELRFDKVVLDPQIGEVCYAVTAADVDGDQKLDAVAISEREVVWYHNPDWKKHVMVRDAMPRDLVCITAADLDKDGQVDFALGAGWPKNGGTIHWIRRGASLDDTWQVHEITAEPWTHRMRMADVLGRGRNQLVVTPLNSEVNHGIRLLAFPIPADPVAGPWVPTVMDGSLHRAHNHWHLTPTQPSDAVATIVASEEGLTRVVHSPDGSGFQVEPLAPGAESEKAAQRGSGEVKAGRLGAKHLLAAIEPMHGNQVVVYIGDEIGAGMNRHVLDAHFVQGHAVWCSDLDQDGRDEVIAAHRMPGKTKPIGPGIYVYHCDDEQGKTWSRRLLDSPMACEDLWCEDFNGDGRTDILAGGRATHDVNLYVNLGP